MVCTPRNTFLVENSMKMPKIIKSIFLDFNEFDVSGNKNELLKLISNISLMNLNTHQIATNMNSNSLQITFSGNQHIGFYIEHEKHRILIRMT